MPDIGICALVPRFALRASIEELRARGFRVSGVGTDVAIYLKFEDGSWIIPDVAITDHTQIQIAAKEYGGNGVATVVCQPNGDSLKPIVDPLRNSKEHEALFVQSNCLVTVTVKIVGHSFDCTITSYTAGLNAGQVSQSDEVIYSGCDLLAIEQTPYKAAFKAALARAGRPQPERCHYRR